MVGWIVVENHYKQKASSHVKVLCRVPGGEWEEIPAQEQGGSFQSSSPLSAANGIELYLEETLKGATTKERVRFKYLRAYVEWLDGDTYQGTISLDGLYDRNKQIATIHVSYSGLGKEPETVNVQVGGDIS